MSLDHDYEWETYKQWLDLYKFYFELSVKLVIWYFVILGSVTAFVYNSCVMNANYSHECSLYCFESQIVFVPVFLGLFLSILATIGIMALRAMATSIHLIASSRKLKLIHRFSPEYLVYFLELFVLLNLKIIHCLHQYRFLSSSQKWTSVDVIWWICCICALVAFILYFLPIDEHIRKLYDRCEHR